MWPTRRLNLFRDDPIVWRTFAVAVGVFVFSVTSALVIGDRPKVSVIVPAVEVAAVLLTIALMRVLLVRAFTSIQLAPALAAIAAEGHSILDDLYRRPAPAEPPAAVTLPPLRTRVLLIALLDTAPPQRRPSIAWRLQHAEDLMAGNFPAIWQDAGKKRARLPLQG